MARTGRLRHRSTAMRDDRGSAHLRFAPFTFDRATGELYRDGVRLHLQEQPRQILTTLLDRPGKAVSREELRARLWPSDTFVDFEHGLNTAVKKLRHALGDSADAPRFIETLPRRGYRFVARVDQVTASGVTGADDAAASGSPATPDGRRRRTTRLALTGAALGLLAGASALVWYVGTGSAAHAPAAADRRAAAQVAVMPFQVLTQASEDAASVGIGFADAIATRLAGTRQISVRPTSAVLPFRHDLSDPVKVAASLAVGHLVTGSIQLGEPSRHGPARPCRRRGGVGKSLR